MFKRIILLICVIATSSSLLKAQRLEQFSENSGEYITQLETFMTSSKREVMEKAFKEFNTAFSGGSFDEDEKKIIIETSNLMLKQKMTASPYFQNYLNGLINVKKRETGADDFLSWHLVLKGILDDIQNRKLKPFKDFVAFSSDFFQYDKIKFSKSGVSWTARADKFNMVYEDKRPAITYEKLDLVGSRKSDTIVIRETSGKYYPVDLRWIGQGGKVSWERFDDKEIYAVLDTYKLDVKKALYTVSNSKLFHPQLFPNGAVTGRFSDKIITQNKATEGSYPRFESYDSMLVISNLGNNITYKGGFKLHGTTVYGIGSKSNNAKIWINDETGKIFTAAAETFVMRKGEKISAEKAKTTVFYDTDSIFHPSVNLRILIPENELTMQRGKRGSDRNPFFLSQHQINVDVNLIRWFIDKDSMIIGAKTPSFTSNKRSATLESLHYFKESDFRRLQNISTVNPLSLIRAYADDQGTNFLDANGLAQKFNPRFDVSSIQSLLYDLVAQGFVDYDSDSEMVEIKDKVFHYTNASQKKVDYDVLRIVSESDSTNAVFDLKKKEILTNGVTTIEFSNKQNVALKPLVNQVVMKQNRDMDFDGRVFAGFSVIEGKDYSFEYEKNHILLDSIRYFDLFLPTDQLDEFEKPIAHSIGSRIEHASGVLLIDAPTNKSGEEDIPMYPSMESKGKSYVYYDSDSTFNRVYKRDSFYFELKPFSFNSLDDFEKEALSFDGNMISADIFPSFKETITLQDDKSLGFITQTPGEGYPNYLSKGQYKGEISLSNQGFLGKGNIKYLGASLDSEDIIFKPKQLLGTAKLFDLKEDRQSAVEVPQALGYDVSIDWRPYLDSMYIRSKEKPFELFKEDGHTLTGLMILTPGGLKGRGKYEWEKGIVSSDLISFGAFSVLSDTSNLQIRTFGEDALAFDTKNVNIDLNFDDQKGKVKANADDLMTTMPYNKYQTSLNEFVWDMKEETITFQNENNLLGTFLSIHPDQDSLRFLGKTAFYNLKTNELKIGGVPRIQTCDAYISTEEGDVEIRPGGSMNTLTNARIVADTVSKYHVINRATVDIKGKRDYRAKGFYEYNIGDKKQEIEFANIIGTGVGKGAKSEKKTVTRATGTVAESDNFYIDKKTEFRGKISLSAEKQNLSFDGFARMESAVIPNANWFTVSCEADKKDLAIEYNVPKNYEGEPLRNGLFLSKEFSAIYPRVMMGLLYRKDRPILEAKGKDKGIFKYNKIKDEFIFGDSLKVNKFSQRGNLMTLSNTTGKIKAEGKFNIGSGLTYMDVQASGQMETSITSQGGADEMNYKLLARMMAGVNFEIPDKLMRIITLDLESSSFDARPIDYKKDGDFYQRALSEFILDEKALISQIKQMNSMGLDLPNKYNKFKILFSSLPMMWNSELQSFISAKDLVGVASVNGMKVNRLLNCFVEFKMPSNEDDRVYIYLKSPSENWYFFSYKQGVLSTVSNNNKYNDTLLGMKEKDLQFKQDDGEFYEIAPVNPGTAQMFVNRVKGARGGN